MRHADLRGRVTALLLGLAVLSAACVPPTTGDAAEPSGSDDPVPEHPEGVESSAAEGWHGEWLDDPIERPEITLEDTDGEPFAIDEETEGQITLLFFGFTHCPDVCPAHLATISAALDRLPYSDTRHVDVVFVTVDPERDTAERLEEYVGGIDERITALRGDLDEVIEAMDAVDLPPPAFGEPDEDGAYDVSHAAAILAFSEDGPARLVYPFGIRSEGWVADLPRMVRGEEIAE